MALVSVIVPTRGRPEMVCTAVRSVLDQTMGDLEVVVVIDGEDPASEKALHGLGDARVRVLALSERVGGSEARNTGVRAANSPWIALLDDDDEWLPNKLAVQMTYVQPAGLQVQVTKYILRDGKGPDLIWPYRFPRPEEPISEYFLCTSRNVFQTSTILCSRELLLRNPFTKGLKRLQDWDWLLRVLPLPDVTLVTVPDVLSVYNCGNSGPTISKAFDWEGSLQWARDNRALLTPRAYRGFIAKKCAPDAASQHASLSSVWLLFSECLRGENFNLREPLMFLMYYFIPPAKRQALANLADRWTGGKREHPKQQRSQSGLINA